MRTFSSPLPESQLKDLSPPRWPDPPMRTFSSPLPESQLKDRSPPRYPDPPRRTYGSPLQENRPRDPSPPRYPDPPRRTYGSPLRQNRPRDPSPPRYPDPPRRTYGSPLRQNQPRDNRPRDPSPPRYPNPPRRTSRLTSARNIVRGEDPCPPGSPDPPRRAYGSPLRQNQPRELSPSRERLSRYETFQRSRDFLPVPETKRAPPPTYPSPLEWGYKLDPMRRAAPGLRMDRTSNYRFSSPHRQMTERDTDNLQRQRYSRYDNIRESKNRFSSPRQQMDKRDQYDFETATSSDEESRWRYRSRPAPRYGSPVRRSRYSGRRY